VKLDELRGRLEESEGHRGELNKEVNRLRSTITSFAGQSMAQIEALQGSQTKFARELEAVRCSTTFSDRLQRLEQRLGSLADGHGEELATIRARLDQLGALLATCEEKSASAFKEDRATIRDRLELLERSVAKVVNNYGVQSTELQEVRVASAKELRTQETHVRTCLDAMETMLKETLGKQAEAASQAASRAARELEASRTTQAQHAALEARVDQIHARLLETEEHGSRIRSLQVAHREASSEKEVLRAQELSLKERLDSLERMVEEMDRGRAAELRRQEESRAGQVRELAALKAAIEQQQEAMADRLSLTDRTAAEAWSRHEMGAAHNRVDQLASRLVACEAHGASIAELRMAQAALAPASDRIDCLERGMRELRISQAELDKVRGVMSTVRSAWSHDDPIPFSGESRPGSSDHFLGGQRNNSRSRGMNENASSTGVMSPLRP